MRITFVLPAYTPRPVGGFKVAYEYASRLAARGHRVAVVHPYRAVGRHRRAGADLLGFLRWDLGIRRHPPIVPWFRFHPGVEVRLVPALDERYLPPADAVVATAWQTAGPVAAAGARRGAKYYLIQHHETWSGRQEEVDATWTLPLHKVVIARWLLRLAEGFGEAERTTYIPNGLDLDRFRPLRPIEARDPLRVGMLYHPAAWKGTADGLAALALARAEFPGLRAELFGTVPPGADIPPWAAYRRDPPQAEVPALYSAWAVFLHPSWTEGWPLPPAEAMACGCALVAAGNEGVLDYATHGETALVAPVREPAALAARLRDVLADDGLRQRLARAGHDRMRTQTWDRAVDRFEGLLAGRGA